MSRASLDKAPVEVAAMFDAVAARYDLTNDVLSVGQARRWRKAVAVAMSMGPSDRVLDLAAGTGTSTVPFVNDGAFAVACDFSLGMLTTGRSRQPTLPFVAGDALALPFADGVFDAVTISFGLRNVADVPAALAELARVTRPGGRLVVCEFSHPTWAPWRALYLNYLMRALPRVASAVSSDPESYVYSPSRSAHGPTSRHLPRASRAAGGARSSGATCPAGSSRYTAQSGPADSTGQAARPKPLRRPSGVAAGGPHHQRQRCRSTRPISCRCGARRDGSS